jgi:phospho-N-acetylmuramoyl-pentapeptide-transferase
MKISGINKNGMPARTKILWQIILAMIVSFYVYAYLNVSTALDVPFLKKLVIDLGPFYVLLVMIILIGTSNAVNLTDGLDGLAIGCTLLVASTLAILCYITGNIKFSSYLFIPYIPWSGELTIF